MDHMKLTDELRQQLMESAAWAKADVTPRLDESSEVEELEEKASCGSSKKKAKNTPR